MNGTMNPWYGVDFDGTLAEYGKWQGATHCGALIEHATFGMR